MACIKVSSVYGVVTVKPCQLVDITAVEEEETESVMPDFYIEE